jgi:hypothetical protein
MTASSRKTVRAGTLVRVHDRLCACQTAGYASDRAKIPLYRAVATLRQDIPGLSVADVLAMIAECDGW